MTLSKIFDKTGNKYYSCCDKNTNKWVKLRTFENDNHLSRKQIYLLAKKGLINMLTYRGKVYVRWSSEVNSKNYTCS